MRSFFVVVAAQISSIDLDHAIIFHIFPHQAVRRRLSQHGPYEYSGNFKMAAAAAALITYRQHMDMVHYRHSG